MKKEIVIKYSFKHFPLVIIAFSLISTGLSIFSINFSKYITTTIFQYILFVINFFCSLFFMVINIKSLEKSLKRNIVISAIIYIFLLINIFVSFDFYFIKSNLIHAYSIFSILFIIPIYPILLLGSYILGKLADNTFMGIILSFISLFFIIIINNIIFTILFKFIKYKNDNKYITLTLYYFQNNSLSIIMLLFAYLSSWA
jgi:hypothetical protein